ncbi:MAG: hypothetical protein K0Q71_5112 [Thermomicrobiales bacterium]|nr:hypothetical protein [Thermomicrobiales bacterium]
MGSSDAALAEQEFSPLARIRQGLRALVPAPAAVLPPRYARHLPAGVAQAWETLGAYDQRHLIAVAGELAAAGHSERVVLAGLLHDIGKAGRVSVVDRVAVVMLDRLSPKLRDRLASRPRPLPGLDGLHLLLGHAESGANLLAEAGMTEDVVWLVRNHERRPGSVSLRALQTADHRH